MREEGFYWVNPKYGKWEIAHFVKYGDEKFMQHWERFGYDDNTWADEDFMQIDETPISNPHE
jgi:hypothetical protein